MPGTSICTKNQPRRPILRANGGEQKIPPDCFQVHRFSGWSWFPICSGLISGLFRIVAGRARDQFETKPEPLGNQVRPERSVPDLFSADRSSLHLGFCDLFTGRTSSIFGGLGGPGRPGNLPKRWGASAPTFLEGFPVARSRPDPPKSTISSRPKNHILKTKVCDITAWPRDVPQLRQ